MPPWPVAQLLQADDRWRGLLDKAITWIERSPRTVAWAHNGYASTSNLVYPTLSLAQFDKEN
jgi:hypothetical protein